MRYLILGFVFLACGPRSVPGGPSDPEVLPTPAQIDDTDEGQQEAPPGQADPPVPEQKPEVLVIPALTPDEPLPSDEPVGPTGETGPTGTTGLTGDTCDRCSKQDKVLMCKRKKRNCRHSKDHEICISKHAVPAHLRQGDTLGSCQQ